MKVVAIDPRGLTPMEWCDYTADILASIMPPMKVQDDDGWREFGAYVSASVRRVGAQTPDPYRFDDFEDWAFRFNQGIASLEV